VAVRLEVGMRDDVGVALFRRCDGQGELIDDDGVLLVQVHDGLAPTALDELGGGVLTEDGLGKAAGFGEEVKADGDGPPAREGQDDLEESRVEGDDSLPQRAVASPRRSHTTDGRRGSRWALFRRAWVGVDGVVLRLGGTDHEVACRKASVVLGLGGLNGFMEQKIGLGDLIQGTSEPQRYLHALRVWCMPNNLHCALELRVRGGGSNPATGQ